jgi:23S rRNA (guanine745-N1)-methyltransferase
MAMVATQWLLCPVCSGPLADAGKSASCAAGHSFDFARSGYLNLTRSGRERPRAGDTRAMVVARDEFLAGGHLEPIARAVADRAASGVADQAAGAGADGGAPPPALVEVGSGTGYHLAAAAARLREGGHPPAAALGIDLSKEAVGLAARRHPDLDFVVADVQSGIPVRSGSVDALLSVLAPRPAPELARVVRPGGRLVVAFAGPRHLAVLRARLDLMDVHGGKLETLRERLGEWFEPAGEELVEHDVVLTRAAAESAVMMGPNARHEVDLGTLDGGIEDTVSVLVAEFRRAASPAPGAQPD